MSDILDLTYPTAQLGACYIRGVDSEDTFVSLGSSVFYSVVKGFARAATEENIDFETILLSRFDAKSPSKLDPKKSRRMLISEFGKQALADPSIKSFAKAFAKENSEGVKGFNKKKQTKIAQAVASGFSVGAGSTEIAKQIKTLNPDINIKQAMAIAADQVTRLHGQMTAELSAALGIKRFQWLHNGNPNGRPIHIARNKKTYSFDSLPGQGELPGEWKGCNCIAKPIFKKGG